MTKKELAEDFGWNLQRQLEKYDIKQYELAEDIGVSKQLVGKYVRGECLPAIDKILNIKYIIGCDWDDLFDFDEYIEED